MHEEEIMVRITDTVDIIPHTQHQAATVAIFVLLFLLQTVAVNVSVETAFPAAKRG